MSLPEKIFSLDSFSKQFNTILKESCTDSLTNITRIVSTDAIDWNNMISCASILSLSEEFEHQEAALRIAQSCLENKSTNETQKIASSVLLDNLTNRPAIRLAVDRNYLTPNYAEKIPLPLLLDISKRKITHTIFNGTTEIYLNKFQKEAYSQFLKSDIVSVSAPTSAGKSFILYQTLIHLICNSKDAVNIVYIVPTRALIGQVERDFKTNVAKYEMNDVFISSVPKLEMFVKPTTQIFVFTQERLHWFRIENPNFKFNYVIIDEAQKISEGSRGILLQQKIEQLIKDSPAVKVFYSSALTSNPETLYCNINDNRNKSSVQTEFVAVNQNLLYITQVPRNTREWNVELSTKKGAIPLGTIQLQNRPTGEHKKIAFIAHALSHKDGGSIIYMNKPGYAEKLANILFDVLPVADGDSQINELIEFTQKTVHKNYLLNKVLKKRIAFHYGNMPVMIRQEIERLFEKGVIKYIICTSTLLEGINLPAKSIFLKNPTRGTGNPLKNAEFWNLAGRAGRLGKEFQGNIVCIEPHNWTEKPSLGKRKQAIYKSIDKISVDFENFIDYIKDKTPLATAKLKPEYDYALTYYYSAYIQNEIPALLNENNKTFIDLLTAQFDQIKTDIQIPTEIILRNPGISPYAQQELLNHFKANDSTIENHIPELPEAEDAVKNSYSKIVGLISRLFSGEPETLTSYYSILVVNWMRGYPLSVLITRSINYYASQPKPKKLDSIIRDTMKDVEEFARFKFAKYSACYIDILRYYLNTNGKKELANNIPNLHMWLEFGVSQGTQISLISLGLTRQTSIMLSEFISNDNYTKEECLAWIRSNDLTTLQLSQIVLNEITETLSIQSTSTP